MKEQVKPILMIKLKNILDLAGTAGYKVVNANVISQGSNQSFSQTITIDAGTNAVAKIVAEQTRKGACKSIAGGGDTVSALENAKSASDFTYISTAGGAFLEWLEGKELPGVKALTK